VNFSGMSFQDAQFAIIDTLLKTTDEECVSCDLFLWREAMTNNVTEV